MIFLRADTNTEVLIGPVVAVGDGFTPVTTLSLSTADEAELIKYGGASALTTTSISGSTMSAITGADGYYTLDLSTGNTDTEGFLSVCINDDSLCLPVRHDFMVVNANVYDSLFAAAATDYLQTDVTQWAGTTATDYMLGVVAIGTAQAATATTLQLASAETFADDELIGSTILITGGSAGVGQSRVITDYVSSTDTATVDTWTTTPTGTITYVIVATPPASTSSPSPVNVTQFGGSAGTFSGGIPAVNTTQIEGSDATDQINAACDTALTDYDAATGTELAAVDTKIDTIDTNIDSLVSDLANIVLVNTTIATLSTQTSFTLTAGSADDDAYNDCIAVITDASTATQKAVSVISDYTGLTKTVTLAADPAVFTMAASDLIAILPMSAADTVRINGAGLVGDGNGVPWDGA